jgi:membrane protease YdiL (CAAX protease family)
MKFNTEFEQTKPFNWIQATLSLLAYGIGYLILIPTITFGAIEIGLINEQYVYIFNGVLIGILLLTIMFIMASLSYENVQNWTWSKRIQQILRHVLYIYVTLIGVNALLGLVTNLETSENQQIIMEAFKQAPVYIIFVAVIFAPIVEEILFRGIIYRAFRYFKFRLIAVFMSSFLFGLIHVYEPLLNGRFDDAWFIFVYMAIGLFMCFIYEKSGDILTPILLHMVYNAVAVLTLFFI